MNFTFVTALYEIPRHLHDGRTFDMYQKWFSETLKIPVPMVIYTEEKNRTIIESARKNLPTKVIYSELNNVPFFHTKPVIESIIKNSPEDSNIKKLLNRVPNVLEFNCYDYIPIVNSKFVWMLDAVHNNFFNTDMFFWIDAGLSRFMAFDISIPSFNVKLIDKIHNENLLYMQIGRQDKLENILNGKESVESNIGNCVNFIMAGFWGGNKQMITDVCEMGKKLYFTEYIEKYRIDNEQVLFGFILQKFKTNLLLVPNVRKEYLNYYVFCDQHIS
jgi:hypothetical protein